MRRAGAARGRGAVRCWKCEVGFLPAFTWLVWAHRAGAQEWASHARGFACIEKGCWQVSGGRAVWITGDAAGGILELDLGCVLGDRLWDNWTDSNPKSSAC